jgi:AcrR family transcriptional regulator
MKKGEITRQNIIAKAAPLFNQRGYAGCSMQDVMAATGLEKGGLYRHFSSKEELAVEAYRYAVGRAVKLRTDNVDRAHGAVELLLSLVKRFVETRGELPGGCPVMNIAIDSDDGNPLLRKLAQESIQDWQKRLSAIVETGIRNGEIRKGTVPRTIANSIIATLEGALMISRLEGKRTALEDAQRTLRGVIQQIATDGTAGRTIT